MAEFELIRRVLAHCGETDGSVVIGPGDDAAVMVPEPGMSIVATADLLNVGVHFLTDADPASLGHKALAVNLSDLAAMGAEPRWFLLSLALPDANPDWLDAFARGLSSLADESGIVLVGGDTTSGPLSVGITALGQVEAGAALTRAGAAPGQVIVVSGYPGLAARALPESGPGAPEASRQALDRPTPRLALGAALRGLATACIDISDGLAADLGHVLRASGVGARVEVSTLPVHPSLSGMDASRRFELAAGGGDDYELCFTVAQSKTGVLESLSDRLGVPLTAIGQTTDGDTLRFVDEAGRDVRVPRTGFEHFDAASP